MLPPMPSIRLVMTAVVTWSLLPMQGLASEAPTFNRDVRPILAANCFECHGPDEHKRQAELRLDEPSSRLQGRNGKPPVLIPGQRNAGALPDRILSTDPGHRMPPPESNKQLSPQQKEILLDWIEAGAAFQPHWAFIPPSQPGLPEVRDPRWTENPVDAFIYRKLQQTGLKPSDEAPKAILARRVHLDLLGLPPSPDWVRAFERDDRPDAYERLVDQLLASEHYGERMAVDWMDAARYGDTSVFHADGPRDMWPWRDGVIRAFNENQPYDQFTVEQLAGDLLPNPTLEQKIASGFLRNNGTTDEGGVIDEEYRVEYAVDRVKTVSRVWLGLTMECSQCHDHKYDPITMRDYYQFFAYFNQSKERGMQTRNGNAVPLIAFFTPEQEKEHHAVLRELEAAKPKKEARRQATAGGYETWLENKGWKTASSPARNGLTHEWRFLPGDEAPLAETFTGTSPTIEGPAKVSPWARGHALTLDGETFLTTGVEPPKVESDQPLTFSAFVRLPKESSSGPILAHMDTAQANRGWDFWIQGRNFGIHLIHNWPDKTLKVVSKEALKQETWHHIAVTYDGSKKASGIKLYLDGKLIANNVEKDGLEGSLEVETPLMIGRRSTGKGLKAQIDLVQVYQRALSPGEIGALDQGLVLEWLETSSKLRSARMEPEAREFHLRSADPEYAKWDDEVNRLEARSKEQVDSRMTAMIMEDVDPPRPTYILKRGAYDAPDKGEVILPGVPQVLPPMLPGAPANRLGLAQWLIQPNHPLTARVTVNRYWQMFFGQGLVRTTGDFGSQGEWPSHPELLDWLARDFVQSGWDLKRLVRTLVTSRTYRQHSRYRQELQDLDPENLLLARAPRFRLQAEFVRDLGLAAAGLLVPETGGPGVKPYQPDGLWNEVSLNGKLRFSQDSGAKLYRRGLYTYWKRSAPAPSMILFDAPTRDQCVVKRQRTNTPLQALVTLNDPQFVEISRAFAKRILKQGGKTDAERLDFGHRWATALPLSQSDQLLLIHVLNHHRSKFRNDPTSMKALLEVGDLPQDSQLDPVEWAAYTAVANLLLNLDASLMRG